MGKDARLGPVLVDDVPWSDNVTKYDEEHEEVYIQLLDADARGVGTEEMARTVLGIDASEEPARARKQVDAHLARARWMTEHGYRKLVGTGLPEQHPILARLKARLPPSRIAAPRRGLPRRR